MRVILCAARFGLLGGLAAFLHAAALLRVVPRCAFSCGCVLRHFVCGFFVLGVLGFGGSPGYALGRVAVFALLRLACGKGKAL